MEKMKNQTKLAYWMAAVLLAVGVLSYTAFSAKPPEEPVRIMLTASAGNVLFTHDTHSGSAGYGVDCFTCHHHPDGDDYALRSCGDCHNLPEDGSTPDICLECHDEGDFELDMVPSRADAFHLQCAGCHEEMGAGPMKEECSMCHVR